MFILRFLLLTIFNALFLALMTLRKRVEGLHATAFVYPFTLAGGGELSGLINHGIGLGDRLVKPVKERPVIVPGGAVDAILRRGDKALMVFGAILLEQRQTVASFLFAGEQFAEAACCIFHAQLRKIQYGLKWKWFAHGEGSRRSAIESAVHMDLPGRISSQRGK